MSTHISRVCALLLGLALGLSAAYGLAGKSRAAHQAQAKAAAAQARHGSLEESWRPASQLGQGAAPIEHALRQVLADRRAALKAQAQAMNQPARIAHIMKLLTEHPLVGWQLRSQEFADLALEVGSFMLPEDFPQLWKLYMEPDSGLSYNQALFLRYRFGEVAAQYPMEDFAFLKSTDPGIAPRMLQSSWVGLWKRDPFAAIGHLNSSAFLDLGRYGWDGENLRGCFREAAMRDQTRALAEIELLNNVSHRSEALAGVMEVIAQTRGLSEALLACRDISSEGLRLPVQISLLESYARNSPESRAETLGLLQDPELDAALRADAQKRILETWISTDLKGALAWQQDHLDSAPDNLSVRHAFEYLAKRNLVEALDLAGQMSGAQRRSAFDQIYEILAIRDPATALDQADKLPSEDRPAAVNAVVRKWAENEPAKAAGFVDSISNADPDYPKLLESVTYSWMAKDPAATSAWLEAKPAGAYRDHAVSALVDYAVQEDKLAAAEWSLQIVDARKRREVQYALMWQMHAKPDTAREWIAQRRGNGLTESEASVLLRMLERFGRYKD